MQVASGGVASRHHLKQGRISLKRSQMLSPRITRIMTNWRPDHKNKPIPSGSQLKRSPNIPSPFQGSGSVFFSVLCSF